MPRAPKTFDRPFLFATLLLVVMGFFIFSSASLGLLTRSGADFFDVTKTQFLFGVCGGLISMFVFANIPYRKYRRFAPYIFGFSLFLTLLVFVPGIGYEANGARRWLLIFGLSFQPAEVLKIAFVLCLAWFYSVFHRKLGDVRYSLGGLICMVALCFAVLFKQPDTKTLIIISVTGIAMTFSAGISKKHIAGIVAIMVVAFALLAFSRPYLLDRVMTFVDPARDERGSGYQLKQSLIAIGSGGVMGRGYGQSVQKFHYLPEPIGDSIFSVAGEEFGFLGTVTIVALFIFFVLRGLVIASLAPDRFGGLLVVGIVILIFTQSFMNIGSMVGLIPLTGVPLVFISHGGTALLLALTGVGMVLNVSRYRVPHKRNI